MRTFIALALIILGSAAHAGAPAGVWSLPSGVTITGAETDFPAVIIVGLFTVHTGAGPVGGDWDSPGFEPTREGFMFYACKPGEKDQCLLQWEDIKTAAADEGCVGWGQNDGSNGTVHANGEPTGTPDSWDLGVGVVSEPAPCEYLGVYDPPQGEDIADAGGPDAAEPGGPIDVSEVIQDSFEVIPDSSVPEVDAGPGDDVPDASDPTDSAVGQEVGNEPDVSAPDSASSDTAATDTFNSGTLQDGDDGCAAGLVEPLALLGFLGLVTRRRGRARG